MKLLKMRLSVLCQLLLCLSSAHGTSGFLWGPVKSKEKDLQMDDDDYSYSEGVRSNSPMPNSYAIALQELKELESEPLCHRNAARLLVSNCQLIDGKDETTVMKDSGRLARDFVDSFAISLAICDLERGSFIIPSECSKFQESTISKLAISNRPQLHVSTTEIDRCLEGLGRSDSAWNTWVSYRHKAVRFCEAARVNNERDRDIRVYQRLTKILARLTKDIDTHMEARFENMEKELQRTRDNMDSLEPHIDKVKSGLEDIEYMVSTRLQKAAQASHDILTRGSSDARDLKELLSAMVENMLQTTQVVATSQEYALKIVTEQVSDEAQHIMTALAATLASTASLHHEIETSRLKAIEVNERQEFVEAGMHRLQVYMEALVSGYTEHDKKLKAAQARAEEILGTLDSVASSAKTSLTRTLGLSGWWPYFYCPAASLFLGSYGLPPSAVRNIGLIALGEAAGFLVSVVGDRVTSLFETSIINSTVGLNHTSLTNEPTTPNDAFTNFGDLR